MRTSAIVAVMMTAALTCAEAQWLNFRDPAIPRLPDGRPNLSAPAPRLNGKPDLSGLWQAERTPVSEFVRVLGPGLPAIQPDLDDVTKHLINVLWDVKPGEEPLRPAAAALTEQRQKSGRDFQSAYCQPGSLPVTMLTLNVKMVQAPGEIVVLPGNGDPPRQVDIDGRSLPKDAVSIPDSDVLEYVCTENEKDNARFR